VKPDASILDSNLERLLRRAYVQVRARDEFRERVGREFVAAVAKARRRRERAPSSAAPSSTAPSSAAPSSTAPSSPLLRWSLIAAAAVVLVFLSRGLWPGGGSSARSLEQILASGEAAARSTEQAPWRAVEARDDLAHVVFEGEFLELVTPASLPAQVTLAGAKSDARWSVFPASHVKLERDPGAAAFDAHLLRGGVVARSAGGGAATQRVLAEQGETLLRGAFDVRLAIEAPDEPSAWSSCADDPSKWLHVTVRRGAVDVPVGGAASPRQLGPGDETFLCNGTALERRDEGANSAPDRTQVGAQEPETSTPAAAERQPLLRAVVTSNGDPVPSFEVVALRALSLPQVAEPLAQRFESDAGEFELQHADADRQGLQDGDYTVFVKAAGFAIARLELAVTAGAATQTARLELERGARVEGLVVDAQSGRPIEGAYVVSETDSQLAVLSIDPSQNGSFALSATSRAGGDFALEPLSRGSHSLRASAPGYGPAWLEVRDLTPGEARAGLRFALRPAGSLAGVVLDDEERPVQGALILASTTDFERKRPSLTYANTQTDADGRYRIENLGEGSWAALNFGVRPGAIAPAYRFARIVAGETTVLDFRPAQSTRALVGRVLNADGTPAAGRTLMVGSSEEFAGPGDPNWLSTNTDASGAYRANGLAPGRKLLYISGATPAEMMSVGAVEVGLGSTTEHDVVLGGVELRGRVFDGERSQPLAFAVVLVIDRTSGDGRFQGRVFANADGAYRFGHLGPGVYDVFVYATRGEYGQEQRLGLLVEGSRDVEDVDFTLFAGGRIGVRVADKSGAPVAAELRFFDAEGVRVQFSENDRTSDSGRSTVRGVKPGAWTVSATAAGFEPATGRIVVQAGERAEVELVLTRR
jgi:hypothetical protein